MPNKLYIKYLRHDCSGSKPRDHTLGWEFDEQRWNSKTQYKLGGWQMEYNGKATI